MEKVHKHETQAEDDNLSTPLVRPIRPPRKRKVLLIVLSTILLAGAIGAAWWLGRQSVAPTPHASQPTATVTPNPSIPQKVDTTASAQDPELARFTKSTTGEVWYDQPKPLAAKGWFMAELRTTYASYNMSPAEVETSVAQGTPDYFEVGTRGDAKIVIAYSSGMAPKSIPHLFEIAGSGAVHAIANPAANASMSKQALQDYSNELTPKVVVDTTTHYDSLTMPKTIKLDNGEQLTAPDYFDGLGARSSTEQYSGVTEKTMATFGGSALVRRETTYKDTHLTNIGFTMVTPLKTTIGLQYEPNPLSLEGYSFDNGAATTVKAWDGKTVTDAIHPIARGCGGTSAAVTRTDALTTNAIVAVGKTPSGRTVYAPKDRADALFKKAYEEYKTSFGDTAQLVSFDQFVDLHALMVIEDAQKELLVYVRDGYAMMGGCAKPVVYLYPTTTSDVSVQVGASVHQSDPQYEQNGWQHVTAQPDGTLSYRGKTYDSLFWEGTGIGSYPGIVGGVVVPRSEAAFTMQLQLAAQGLNQKEINDFMTYWQPRIPNTPYVRLTWLNTADMNQLAPLSVTPQPDTTIRVFLDMDGSLYPYQLPAQHLQAIPRQGFTVVEWGGLVAGRLE